MTSPVLMWVQVSPGIPVPHLSPAYLTSRPSDLLGSPKVAAHESIVETRSSWGNGVCMVPRANLSWCQCSQAERTHKGRPGSGATEAGRSLLSLKYQKQIFPRHCIQPMWAALYPETQTQPWVLRAQPPGPSSPRAGALRMVACDLPIGLRLVPSRPAHSEPLRKEDASCQIQVTHGTTGPGVWTAQIGPIELGLPHATGDPRP